MELETRPTKDLQMESLSEKMKVFTAFVSLVQNYVVDEKQYDALIHPEAAFIEFPNLVTKNGQKRTIAMSMKSLAMSKTLLANQHYEYLNWFENGNQLVVEKKWGAEIAMDIAHFKKGQKLEAHICVVAEFKDGKLYRQRNYDSYEPF